MSYLIRLTLVCTSPRILCMQFILSISSRTCECSPRERCERASLHRKLFVPPRENAERHLSLLCVFACHVKAPLTNHVEKASFESDDAPMSLC
jgi:hypothetical protein